MSVVDMPRPRSRLQTSARFLPLRLNAIEADEELVTS